MSLFNNMGDPLPKKVYKPKLDTSNWKQSSLDSMKLYNAYQFQKNNTIIKTGPQGATSAVNLRPDSYKPIKDTNAEYKILLSKSKKQEDDQNAAMRRGDYNHTSFKNPVDYTNIGIHTPIDLKEFKEREQFSPIGIPSNYNQNKKIIDYYRSMGIPDKDINFYNSPDVFNSKIKPIGEYFDGQAYSPVYKKPIGVQKPKVYKPKLDTSNWEQSSLDSLSLYNKGVNYYNLTGSKEFYNKGMPTLKRHVVPVSREHIAGEKENMAWNANNKTSYNNFRVDNTGMSSQEELNRLIVASKKIDNAGKNIVDLSNKTGIEPIGLYKEGDYEGGTLAFKKPVGVQKPIEQPPVVPTPVIPPPVAVPKVNTKFQIQETNFGAPIQSQWNATTGQYVPTTGIPKDTPQSDITTKPWVNEMKGHAQGGQVNNNQKQNNMGSLYYMSGGWHSKNKYATGGTTLPYQMAPEYPEYEELGYNYDTTKKVGQAGLAVTKASGNNPYIAAGAAIATVGAGFYDIAKSKENNKLAHNRNQGVGEGVKDINFANSAYSQDGGYNQYNVAQGGPIWHMLGKNPQQFQMDQNNNQTSYRMGGEVGNNQDYGIIAGNGSPTADDKRMDVEAGSFVVPFDKGGKIKSILEHLGYNPNKTINPNNSFATGGNKSPINISSKETYLNPEMADEVAEYLGGDEEMEKQLSPNSPHNIYAATGGKMGNNYVLGGRPIDPPVFIPPNKKPPLLDPPDYTPPAIIPPDNTTPPPQRNFEDPAEDAKIASDEMTEEARRQNKTMLGINTAKAAGMGIWNALQKNPEMPKQGRFNPMLISSNTEAMGAEQNYLSAKAGATARRAATEGNINQTVSNASIQANTLAQQVTDANQRSAINQRVNEANVGTLNQASLYNLQADNQYNQMNAERTAAFKQNKATAISGNINDAAKGYNNYANANLGINALEKGYNSGKINQALYQKAMNNPESLTPEEVIILNSITGGNFNPANLS